MSMYLHWRTMAWALVLWSAYVGAWAVMTGSGPAPFILWWLAGTIILSSLWLATQAVGHQRHGVDALFVRPGSPHDGGGATLSPERP